MDEAAILESSLARLWTDIHRVHLDVNLFLVIQLGIYCMSIYAYIYTYIFHTHMHVNAHLLLNLSQYIFEYLLFFRFFHFVFKELLFALLSVFLFCF